MADVFLSYKREERAAVERLAAALRGLGLEVWFDASLSAGEAFSDEIDREVRAAKAVIVCWSAAAAGSRWVKSEAQIGFGKDNLISTYVVGPDGFEPPVPFNGLHTEDMRAWAVRPSARDPAWLSVLRTLGRLAGRADISEWGALGAEPSVAQIESWLAAHAARSPLVVEAESLLRERQAVERERAAAEAAARERAERMRLEKEAAEAAAREAERRARAARRRRTALLAAGALAAWTLLAWALSAALLPPVQRALQDRSARAAAARQQEQAEADRTAQERAASERAASERAASERAELDRVAAAQLDARERARVQELRDAVTGLQGSLEDKGFYDGPIDGVAGPATRAAAAAFARAAGADPLDFDAADSWDVRDFEDEVLAWTGTAPLAPLPDAVLRAVAAAQEGLPPAERAFRECAACPEMIVVHGGDAGGAALPAFAIARRAASAAEWTACADEGFCSGDGGEGAAPAVVSWDAIEGFLAWLDKKAPGAPYRRPSEAEWRLAAGGAFGLDIGREGEWVAESCMGDFGHVRIESGRSNCETRLNVDRWAFRVVRQVTE